MYIRILENIEGIKNNCTSCEYFFIIEIKSEDYTKIIYECNRFNLNKISTVFEPINIMKCFGYKEKDQDKITEKIINKVIKLSNERKE